jgi:hypothetical protein
LALDEGAPEPKPSATIEMIGGFQVRGDCDDLGGTRETQLTFVVGNELLHAGRSVLNGKDGAALECSLKVRNPDGLEWGPVADRVLFGDLRRSDGEKTYKIDDEAESVSWSRPTGKSVVYISNGRLMKVDAFGEKPFDISFLDEHDEVVYHPAGTHIAVTGTDKDGTYGVWLATNLGKEPQLLAIGEDARRIFSLAFSHDGTTLYYAAEHDDHYDVHALRLALSDDQGEIRDARLDTLDSSDGPMGDVVVWEFTFADEEAAGRVAYTTGTCEEGKTTHVWWAGKKTELGGTLAGYSTEPIGFLPDGRLVVIAREGCASKGTLFTWTKEETKRIVGGATVAAVRTILPDPPGPPGSKQQVIA